MHRISRYLVLVATAATVGIDRPSAQQSVAPPDDTASIDVVAVDRQGMVPGVLRASDLGLTIDGKPRPIAWVPLPTPEGPMTAIFMGNSAGGQHHAGLLAKRSVYLG